MVQYGRPVVVLQAGRHEKIAPIDCGKAKPDAETIGVTFSEKHDCGKDSLAGSGVLTVGVSPDLKILENGGHRRARERKLDVSPEPGGQHPLTIFPDRHQRYRGLSGS